MTQIINGKEIAFKLREKLKENIILQAALLGLKADFEANARGVILILSPETVSVNFALKSSSSVISASS